MKGTSWASKPTTGKVSTRPLDDTKKHLKHVSLGEFEIYIYNVYSKVFF